MSNARKRLAIMMAVSSFILHPSSCLLAQAPSLINYQGRLLNGTNLVNGSVGLSLRLYNMPVGGSVLYEDSNSVTVVDGLYATFIGDHPTNDTLLVALTNAAVWVEVAVNGTALSPRERLASSGYSLSTRGLIVTTNRIAIHHPQTNKVNASSADATIAGGRGNSIEQFSNASVIGGRWDNLMIANNIAGTIAGGSGNEIGNGSDLATIGGGGGNSIAANSDYTIIAGGGQNGLRADSSYSSIGGGYDNNVAERSQFATIAGGGYGNIGTNSDSAVIGGGTDNDIASESPFSTIAGGGYNDIGTNSGYAVISGGEDNGVGPNSPYAVIVGGRDNLVGPHATNALAAGRRAKANHPGTFVWADDTAADFASTKANSFIMRASGGVGIGDTSPEAQLTVQAPGSNSTDNTATFWATNIGPYASHIHYGGRGDWYIRSANTHGTVILQDLGGNVGIGTAFPTNKLHVNGTVQALAYITGSDRNMKENIRPVDGGAILDKVAALPIATWTFKQEPNGTHIGPMAQDFHATFGFGNTDTGIMTVDADGVALAAIQALAKENGALKEQVSGFSVQVSELEEENKVLREELEAIKARLGM